MLRYCYHIFTLTIAVLPCFKQKKSKMFRGFALWPPLGGLQCSPDLQLPFHVPLACLFYVLQKTDAPIFFLYCPLLPWAVLSQWLCWIVLWTRWKKMLLSLSNQSYIVDMKMTLKTEEKKSTWWVIWKDEQIPTKYKSCHWSKPVTNISHDHNEIKCFAHHK